MNKEQWWTHCERRLIATSIVLLTKHCRVGLVEQNKCLPGKKMKKMPLMQATVALREIKNASCWSAAIKNAISIQLLFWFFHVYLFIFDLVGCVCNRMDLQINTHSNWKQTDSNRKRLKHCSLVQKHSNTSSEWFQLVSNILIRIMMELEMFFFICCVFEQHLNLISRYWF